VTNPFRDRALVRQLVGGVALIAVIGFVLAFRFTTRSELELERVRARTMLETIHRIEVAYFQEHGTYVDSDRGNTGSLLKWADSPGRFRYRVDASRTAFAAYAEADLDGDGIAEVWRVDTRNPEPVLVRQD